MKLRLTLRVERHEDVSRRLSPSIAELHVSRATVEDVVAWLECIRNAKTLKTILGASAAEVRSLMRDLEQVIIEYRTRYVHSTP